jgi:hypothetical protein
MWEKLIKNHENIVMVMCGHDPTDKVLLTQTKGVNGNTVSQFLIDPQGMDKSGATGMVATFYVSENGEDVTVEWYSAVKQQYYKKSNNYTFKLNVIERAVDEDNNNTELQEEIEALENSLATLKEALEKADVENKQELINLINGLETKINTLKGDLEESDSDIIADINKVKDELAGLKIDLEELVEDNRISLKAEIDSLTTIVIILSIVSSLAVIGVVILAIKNIKK